MTSFLSYLADRDNLQIATVHGPLSIWRADVEIAILNIPSDNAALRTFFVNNLDPLENILGDTRKFNLPNTLLVLMARP